MHDAGVVDGDADAAGRGGLSPAPARPAWVARGGLAEAASVTERPYSGLARLLGDVADDDPSAFRDVALGNRKPNPARTAGDDGDLVVAWAHGVLSSRPA